MADVTSFRVVRSPRRQVEDERSFMRVIKAGAANTALIAQLIEAAQPEPPPTAAPVIVRGARRGGATIVQKELPVELKLAAVVIAYDAGMQPRSAAAQRIETLVALFDDKLVGHGSSPTAAWCNATLARLAERLDLQDEGGGPVTDATMLIALGAWGEVSAGAGDALVSAMVLSIAEKLELDAVQPETLTRRLLVFGLIEALANAELKIESSNDVRDLLFLRTVLLPVPPFPISKRRARFARKPGIMDLEVIRDEWSCFVPGEIAYIENVLAGETKDRVHKQLDEIENTVTRETADTTTNESFSQSSDRFQFEEEARRATSIAVAVNGQVDVSATYAAVKIEAQVGASVSLSFEDSSSRNSQSAREIIQRALTRVESRVREARTTRTLFRSMDRDQHTFENKGPGSANISGIYRWVDKVKRMRSFVYPLRYLLEFELAEPGARLRWLAKRRKSPEGLIPRPPDFTYAATGEQAFEEKTALSPSHITRTNYAKLIGTFQAQGVREPPPAMVEVSGTIQFTFEAGAPDANTAQNKIPLASGTANVAIPPGYKGATLKAALVASPIMAQWPDVPSPSGDRFNALTGYHAVVAGVSVGDTTITLKNGIESVQTASDPLNQQGNGLSFDDAWDGVQGKSLTGQQPLLGAEVIGTVAVAATVAGTFKGHVTVGIEAALLPSSFEQWQLDTFDQLQQAYLNWRTQYDAQEQKDQRDASARPEMLGDSPAQNKLRIIEEIKRQVIEMMMGVPSFDGYVLLENRADLESMGPRPAFANLAAATPIVQFLEQALEWNNMTYVTYPFYWTERKRWPDLEELRANDADFAAFLRAGTARVIVPARPGFQYAVEFFATFGIPWSGGAAPAPGEANYISVAKEIRELTGRSEDGKPGDMWEVKQPTTLVWLDNDSTLPKRNLALPDDFRGTPRPKICPDPA